MAVVNRFAAYRALLGFTCQAPIFALFYLANGLDYLGLMTLAVAFAGAMALGFVELDRPGRRLNSRRRRGSSPLFRWRDLRSWPSRSELPVSLESSC